MLESTEMCVINFISPDKPTSKHIFKLFGLFTNTRENRKCKYRRAHDQ